MGIAGENSTQIFLAKAIIMTEVVTLIFEGIKRFVFYFPSRSAGSHNVEHIFLGNQQIRDPAEFRDFFTLADLCVYSSTLTNISGFDLLRGT